MMERRPAIATEGIGHVRRPRITRDGRTIEPLHPAPQVEDAAITEDEAIPPYLRLASGDGFGAPFGASDPESGPTHGWPANAPWLGPA